MRHIEKDENANIKIHRNVVTVLIWHTLYIGVAKTALDQILRYCYM
jgi:hypothetical protein